ncbi:MAG: hypothetical protein F4188_03795, partial [Chloroflexi bacterium]|nr:hypothetical protein [Chloroflexota bacterium]
ALSVVNWTGWDGLADVCRDLMIATIALRYTQSNSVCLAADEQVIVLRAGQH